MTRGSARRRLFVAAWPPPALVAQLEALPRPSVRGLRWTDPQQWHLTLRFLGSMDDADPVLAAVAAVTTRLPPARATLGPAVGRFGHRVLHVPVEGLERLAAPVVAATAHLGQPPEDRPFVGHLTLARVAKGVRGVDLRELAGTPIAADWPVGELTVVESRLSADGARYEVVARFPLTGA